MEHLSFTATMKGDKGFFKVIPSFLLLCSHPENTLTQQIHYPNPPKAKKNPKNQRGRLLGRALAEVSI